MQERLREYESAAANSGTIPEQAPRALLFLWFEGEKSRLGAERILDDEEVQEYLEKANLEVVSSRAWLVRRRMRSGTAALPECCADRYDRQLRRSLAGVRGCAPLFREQCISRT